jgi:hypothetical protein
MASLAGAAMKRYTWVEPMAVTALRACSRAARAHRWPKRRRVLIRADSGGGTQGFLAWLARPGRRLAYSVGFPMTDDICDAVRAARPRVDPGL